jgi:rhamnulose-1-phosphate aldolase
MEATFSLASRLFQHENIQTLLQEVAEVAGYLWDRGWAERNAGNMSVNVTSLLPSGELNSLTAFPTIELPGKPTELGGNLLLITGSGTRMREAALDPGSNVCFLYIAPGSARGHIICRCNKSGSLKPSSELPTHLAIQQQLARTNSPERVVLHSHVLELIALTQLPRFRSEEAINTTLWGMHPETVALIPDGVGFVPYTLPGTGKMAEKTVESLRNHKVVVWEKHGCMAVSSSLKEAFDTLDILAKSVRIWFLCRSAGLEPEGLTPAQLLDLRENYRL